MPKALQLSHQDLFRMGDTKQRKKKKTERLKLPPKSEPKRRIPETKSRESIFQHLNPAGIWFWMCRQQTVQDSGERGFTFPFFNTILIWPIPL